jgi:hypothetical protein
VPQADGDVNGRLKQGDGFGASQKEGQVKTKVASSTATSAILAWRSDTLKLPKGRQIFMYLKQKR